MDEEICMIWRMTDGAGQQTILRLLEVQETWNGEMNNTHKIYRKSYFEKSRGGWIFNERQYEDLDLRVTIFTVQITTIMCFCNVTSRTLYITHREPNFCALNYLKNLSHLYEVTSTSLLSRGTLLLYVYNVVTVFNMYSRQ